MSFAEPSLAVAQTNLQLYAQMESQGYPADEIAAVSAAYSGAIPFFSAQYRANGKPFITHLVGTASILVSRRAPLAEVLAGLLHAAFQSGDLGVDHGRRQTRARGAVLRALIGAEAAQLVASYDATDWSGLLVAGTLRGRDLADDVARGVTFMFLANTLEDFLDGGMCNLVGTRKSAKFTLQAQDEVMALATDMGWPELAAALQVEFDRFRSMPATAPLSGQSGFSGLVLPPSARRALLPRVLSFIARVQRTIRRRLGRSG